MVCFVGQKIRCSVVWGRWEKVRIIEVFLESKSEKVSQVFVRTKKAVVLGLMSWSKVFIY